MEDRLHRILGLVNDWVKFAEAKNAALVVADSAIIFGIVRIIEGKSQLPCWLLAYTYVVLGIIAVSAIIALISFLPKTTLPRLEPTKCIKASDNLLFYGDIAGYDAQTFLKALYQRAQLQFQQPQPFEEDYAEQIIINSRIALRKYRLFALALWLAVTALVTPILGIPLLLWTRKANGNK